MKIINRNIVYSIVVLVSVLSYLSYITFYFFFEDIREYNFSVKVLSWVGIFIGIYIAITWYKLTGKIVSLYLIFIMFFFLFNYGQPIMWALGIHQPNEIGTVSMFFRGKPTPATILFTQALILICVIMFHLGAVFCYKPRKKELSGNLNLDKKLITKSLYIVCLVVSIIVIPVTFYNSIYNFLYSQLYGYGALYYDENKTNIVLFNFLQYLFFPCLAGLLIGSHYRKKVRYFVYGTFFIFLMINLLSGDRGSWLYSLIILIFMSHNFYKKIEWKRMLPYLVIGTFFLYLVEAITSVRNKGINLESIMESLQLENNPIISAIFEMGNSMTPTLILVQEGWDIFPYPNTYFYAVIGMISTKFITLMDLPFYGTVGDWFSQDYLGISYGSGFSIVAEGLLNYGPLFAPISMIFLGYIITSLIYLDKFINYKTQPLKVFIAVTTLSCLIPLTRGQMLSVTKSWFFGVLVIVILVYLLKGYSKKKSFKKIS